MARRTRALDRSYAHNIKVVPLTGSYWEGDKITPETRALAESAAPEPLTEVVVSAVKDALTPEPCEPLPPKPPRKRKTKPDPPPSNLRIVFDKGEVIGWHYLDTDKFDPVVKGGTKRFLAQRTQTK